jgi:hypothetical protein
MIYIHSHILSNIGQFIATGIYGCFVRGLPEVIDTGHAFPIVKVVIGILIIASSVFAMVVIWLKVTKNSLEFIFRLEYPILFSRLIPRCN